MANFQVMGQLLVTLAHFEGQKFPWRIMVLQLLPFLIHKHLFNSYLIIAQFFYPCPNIFMFCRYAYSDDGSEEFDKDDTLTLIKPSPMPMKDVRGGPEARSLHGGNGLPSEDVEEEKTE